MERTKLQFEQVFDKDERPDCQGCWKGKLVYDRSQKLWVCKGGFIKCGRKYKAVRK